jgi:microtubule-associated protein-like 6
LLTVGQDDKNSLAVYDWEVGRIAWSSPVDGAKVCGAAWKSETEYMTVGLKHVKLWTEGKGAMGKIPGKWDPMLSVVCWNDKFVTGGSSGNLYFWSGSTGNPTKAHEGTVDALGVDNRGVLYSGCSKGMIMTWKLSGGKLVVDRKLYDVSKIDAVEPGVLSFDFYKENMLICAYSSSIYELPISGKAESP